MPELSPCYRCEERSQSCHGTCARYATWIRGRISRKRESVLNGKDNIAELYRSAVREKIRRFRRNGK